MLKLFLVILLFCSGCSSHLKKEPTEKETKEFYSFIRNGGLLSEPEKRMIKSSVISRELKKRNRIKTAVPAHKDKNYLVKLNQEIKKEYQKVGERQVKEMKQISQNLTKNNPNNWWNVSNSGNNISGSCHSVRSYTRKNGTRVRAHTRCR